MEHIPWWYFLLSAMVSAGVFMILKPGKKNRLVVATKKFLILLGDILSFIYLCRQMFHRSNE